MQRQHQRTAAIIAAAAAVAAAAFAAGVLTSVHYLGRAVDEMHGAAAGTAPAAPAGPTEKQFSDDDRLRYWKALDRVRYELLAGPGAPPFEQAVSDEHVRGLIREAAKKQRLLREHCGIEITQRMVGEEAKRMKHEYKRIDIMARIADALDRDPAAVVEFWIRPILVDRYLRACAAYDPAANAQARARAEAARAQALTGDTAGPAWPSVSVPLHSSTLEPEDRDALQGLAPGRVSSVIESLDDFHVFRVSSSEGDTVEAMVLSIKKPDFEQWLKAWP